MEGYSKAYSYSWTRLWDYECTKESCFETISWFGLFAQFWEVHHDVHRTQYSVDGRRLWKYDAVIHFDVGHIWIFLLLCLLCWSNIEVDCISKDLFQKLMEQVWFHCCQLLYFWYHHQNDAKSWSRSFNIIHTFVTGKSSQNYESDKNSETSWQKGWTPSYFVNNPIFHSISHERRHTPHFDLLHVFHHG